MQNGTIVGTTGATSARLPWLALIVLMAWAAVWLMNQPMDMRGIGMAG